MKINILYVSNLTNISSEKTFSEMLLNYLKDTNLFNILVYDKDIEDISYLYTDNFYINQDLNTQNFELCILACQPDVNDFISNKFIEKSLRKIYIFEKYTDKIFREYDNIIQSVNDFIILDKTNIPVKYVEKQLNQIRNDNFFKIFTMINDTDKKNFDKLLYLFTTTFDINDNVYLYIKINNYDENYVNNIIKSIHNKLPKNKENNFKKMCIINHYLDNNQLFDIYNNINCVLSCNVGLNEELFINEVRYNSIYDVTIVNLQDSILDLVYSDDFKKFDISNYYWKQFDFNSIRLGLLKSYSDFKQKKQKLNYLTKKNIIENNNNKLSKIYKKIRDVIEQPSKRGIYV